MKKLLLFCLFSFFFFSTSQAQWGSCEPDLAFQDSIFGVYPPPTSAANPDGGITTDACAGSDYYFVWTLKIPQMVTATIQGIEITLDIDSIIVEPQGGIGNIPTGMTYAMNPPNGVFTPEDSLACITLYGTPQDEGDYDLNITLEVFAPQLAIFPSGSYGFTLPNDDFAGAEGNYVLTVLPSGSPDCFTDTDDILASSFSIRNLPNPFSDFTNIEITANYADELNFRVFDIIGNEIHTERLEVIEGLNNFQFDGSHLSNGIYTYTIEKDGALISNRMVINR